MYETEEMKKSPFKYLKGLVFQELRNRGVTRVDSKFEGSGDSGCIDFVRYSFNAIYENTEESLKDLISHTGTQSIYNNAEKKYEKKEVTKQDVLTSLVEDLIYMAIDANHEGWENNEGASGTIKFIFKENFDYEDHELLDDLAELEDTIRLDISVYETRSDDYSYDY